MNINMPREVHCYKVNNLKMSLDWAVSKIRLSELVTSFNLMIYYLPTDFCTPLAHCSCHCQTQVCCFVHCSFRADTVRNSVISVFHTQRRLCCCTLRCHVSLLLEQSSTSPMLRFVVTQPKNPGGMRVNVDE